MTLTQLIQRFRIQVPDAKKSVISDADITTMLNEGVDKVNLIAKIYKGNVLFAMTENDQDYNLSSVASDFVGPDKSPARFLNSDSQYKKIWPKTRAWMDKKIENWIDAAAGDPQYYWFDGDEFWVYPKPSATRSDGFKLYGLLSAVAMDSGDNYPWNNTVNEIKAFRPMDLAIVAYARWQISPALGKDALGKTDYEGFLKEVNRGMRQVLRRRDIMNDDSLQMSVSA